MRGQGNHLEIVEQFQGDGFNDSHGQLEDASMEFKVWEEREPQKKRNVAFKGSASKKSCKKSAMKATWDDRKTESDEEIDTTNMCDAPNFHTLIVV